MAKVLFNALLNEALFTREILGAGVTQIRRANYASRGIYFQAFTSLSTGLERIAKICLILDHYVRTEGDFPSQNTLKKDIGHNLKLLHEKGRGILTTKAYDFDFPSDIVHKEIIRILGEFAIGDRYRNIDLLVGGNVRRGVTAEWYKKVDLRLWESRVSDKKKKRIAQNSKLARSLFGDYVAVLHTSETESDIRDIQDASFRTGVFNAVAPYRQLYVLQIIRFWARLVCELGHEAQEIQKAEIPFFSEVFGDLKNDDRYFRSRKTWDKH